VQPPMASRAWCGAVRRAAYSMILARLSPLCRERNPDWCAACPGREQVWPFTPYSCECHENLTLLGPQRPQAGRKGRRGRIGNLRHGLPGL
jgi:hypothetical protein